MWKQTLYRKVQQYIKRDVHENYIDMFRNWWSKFSPEILNEFEEVLDAEIETAKREALNDAKLAISKDGNVDSADPNVGRVLYILDLLIAETLTEVDYENPSREDLERMEEDS